MDVGAADREVIAAIRKLRSGAARVNSTGHDASNYLDASARKTRCCCRQIFLHIGH
jgi:hypothetical protein